jgi:hypothetical protein
MRPRWVSLVVALATILAACGRASGWRAVAPSAEAGGVQVRLVSMQLDDQWQPWRSPPTGSGCLVLHLAARSLDGHRHELRPEQFSLGGKTPVNAIGYCNSPQAEPTWVGAVEQPLVISFLTALGSKPLLEWRPQ